MGVGALSRTHLLSEVYIQAYETTVSVQRGLSVGKNHQAYLLVYKAFATRYLAR